jgi:hypothetical protein
VVLFATALLSCAGSGAPTRFVNPEADLPYYERVGVIPFKCLAQDPLGGEKTTNVFYAELLRRHFAEVVEPGQFAAAMTRVRGGTPYTNPWSGEELAKLAEETKVQGFFMGTVRDYEMTPSGRDLFPLLSLEVRLVDATTGRVAWNASQTQRGGPAFPLFGWTEIHTLGELTTRECRALLATLKKG